MELPLSLSLTFASGADGEGGKGGVKASVRGVKASVKLSALSGTKRSAILMLDKWWLSC